MSWSCPVDAEGCFCSFLLLAHWSTGHHGMYLSVEHCLGAVGEEEHHLTFTWQGYVCNTHLFMWQGRLHNGDPENFTLVGAECTIWQMLAQREPDPVVLNRAEEHRAGPLRLLCIPVFSEMKHLRASGCRLWVNGPRSWPCLPGFVTW